MTAVIAVAALLLLVLVLAVLVMPVEAEISASFHVRTSFRTRLRLFSGLVSWEPGAEKGGKNKIRKRGGGGVARLFKVVDAAGVEGMGRMALDMLRQVIRHVEVTRIISDLRISLGDDYYSGMLMAFAIPLVLYLNTRFPGDIVLQPAFEEDLLVQGDASVIFHARPIYLLLPVIVFVTSRQFRRARRQWGEG